MLTVHGSRLRMFTVNRQLILLLLIFLLALVLRVWDLSATPAGFHNDEVDLGYEGLFILKNGHDTYGDNWPIYFDKFGDYRPIGLYYLVGLTELILGASIFATRLPGAFVGALTVLPVFLLAKELFKSRRVGYYVAFALAVLPWHIVLSRASQESIIGIFLITLAVYFVLAQKLRFALPSIFLGYFFYTGHRFLIPFVSIATFFDVWRLKLTNIRRTALIFAVSTVVFTGVIFMMPWGSGRSSQVIFYNNPASSNTAVELANADGPGQVAIARIFHNKAVIWAREFAAQYISYFSPDFLLMRGGLPDRYVIPYQGLIYFSFVPFLILGAAFMIANWKKTTILPLLWLLVTPLPAILTFDDIPNMNRTSFMIIPWVLVVGYGLFVALSEFKGIIFKIILGLVAILFVLELVYFLHMYLVHQRSYLSFRRDGGAEELVAKINELKGSHELVVVPYLPENPIYYLFFSKIYDSNIRLDLKERRDNFQEGNVLFVFDSCPSSRPTYQKPGFLLVDEPQCQVQSGMKQISKIMRLDDTEAYRLYSLE